MLNNLIPVDWSNQRVLTTKQLAECYGCTPKHIKQNFNNAKARFVEGFHFFLLKGETLRSFKREVENFDLVPANARSLYLWTEEGALLHCKMINTDEAWNVFKDLTAFYFAHRNDNVDELKEQIADLKRENAALKAKQPFAPPRPVSDSKLDPFGVLESIFPGLQFIEIKPPKK